MKTPLQIALDKFNSYDLKTGKSGFRRILKELIEKEKGIIITACNYGYRKGINRHENKHEFTPYETAQEYYNESFKQ